VKTGTSVHYECIAVSIGWLCLGRFAFLVTLTGFVAKLKSNSLQHEGTNTTKPKLAPGTVRNSFVAEVLSQNLKTDRRNNLHEVLLNGLRAQSLGKVLFKGPIM
jgi:hypothetical protein